MFAAVAGSTGAAVGNATIVDLGGKTVIVDTFMTAQAAEELRTAAVDLTGRSAFLAVNTHWHADHTRGNQVFHDVPIVATRATVALIVANAPHDLVVYEEEIDGYLASWRAKTESEDATERAMARRRLAGLEQIKISIPGFHLILPNVLIDDRLVLAGDRDLEILTYGGGHTDSDSFGWLRSERTLIAGDLCWTRIHPRIDDGHPSSWADILDRIVQLEPAIVISGHGVPAGPEVPAALAPYFRAVHAMVKEVRGGADPASVAVPKGSEEWDGQERLREGLRVLASKK